ncbi:hypothetical protein [Mesorhizobium sp. RIZ17]
MIDPEPLWSKSFIPVRRSKLENAASPTISLVGSLDDQDAMVRGLVSG